MMEIEKIYYNYQNDMENGGDSDEVQKSRESLYQFLDEKGLNAHSYEGFACDFACSSEKQGFLNGFKYAMKIALECNYNHIP